MNQPIRTITKVHTSNYAAMHGEPPQHTYALWVFNFHDGENKPIQEWISGTLKAATKEATRQARELGYRSITLVA